MSCKYGVEKVSLKVEMSIPFDLWEEIQTEIIMEQVILKNILGPCGANLDDKIEIRSSSVYQTYSKELGVFAVKFSRG